MRETDVLVLGGGPAGAAAAAVLAEAGWRVDLMRPARPPGASLAQSVPPSARSLLADLGFLDALTDAGFVANTGNTIRWAGSPVRHETFGDGAAPWGFHVDRGRLEDALLAPLRSGGVAVHSGFAARRADRAPDGWRVHGLAPDGRPLEVRARWVVDATGRHGFLARRLGRTRTGGPRTLAVVGRWKGQDADPGLAGHTVVESLDDGWVWSVPVAPGVRCVTAMVDPAHTPVTGERLGAWLAGRVATAPLMSEALGGFEPAGEPWACPASTYEAARYHEDRVVLAGDSGAFIDPLSSYGVKKALASGRTAGIAVATALASPDLEGAALDYHERSERRMAEGYHARSARYFAEGARAHPHPFWVDRAGNPAMGGTPDGASGAGFGTDGPDGTSEHRCDVAPEEARRAWDAIRAAPRLRWRAGDALETRTEAALQGRTISLEPHLASARHPRPVRFHGSVDLRRLVALAPCDAEVPELWDAYARSGPAAPLPDFLTALAVSCAAGFLDFEVP